MNSSIYECGLSLEEAFFRKRDAELIEQHRKIERMERTRAVMAEISGIQDAKVLDKLIALEISPEVLAAMSIVPLVEVAWADGHVDERERKAVLEAAAENGMGKGSVEYELFENWLKHRPPVELMDAWVHYIEGLCATMSKQECLVLKAELIGRARKVSEAAGSIFGFVFNVSSQERAVLKKMEDAFSRHTASN